MKRINIEHVENFNCNVDIGQLIEILNQMEIRIMATLDEVMGQLNEVSAKTQKVFAEVNAAKTATEAQLASMQAMIADLQAQVANNQPIDLQPLADKIANDILPALQVLDDINPDA